MVTAVYTLCFRQSPLIYAGKDVFGADIHVISSAKLQGVLETTYIVDFPSQ